MKNPKRNSIVDGHNKFSSGKHFFGGLLVIGQYASTEAALASTPLHGDITSTILPPRVDLETYAARCIIDGTIDGVGCIALQGVWDRDARWYSYNSGDATLAKIKGQRSLQSYYFFNADTLVEVIGHEKERIRLATEAAAAKQKKIADEKNTVDTTVDTSTLSHVAATVETTVDTTETATVKKKDKKKSKKDSKKLA